MSNPLSVTLVEWAIRLLQDGYIETKQALLNMTAKAA
jgi:hypothetical protein